MKGVLRTQETADIATAGVGGGRRSCEIPGEIPAVDIGSHTTAHSSAASARRGRGEDFFFFCVCFRSLKIALSAAGGGYLHSTRKEQRLCWFLQSAMSVH